MGDFVIARAHRLNRTHSGGDMPADMQPQTMRLRRRRGDPGGRHRGVEFRAGKPGVLDLAHGLYGFFSRADGQGALRGEGVLAVDDDRHLAIGREQVAGRTALEDAERLVDHRPRAAKVGDAGRNILQQVPVAAADVQMGIPQSGQQGLAASVNPRGSLWRLYRPCSAHRFDLAILDQHGASGDIASGNRVKQQHIVDQCRCPVGRAQKFARHIAHHDGFGGVLYFFQLGSGLFIAGGQQ